MALGEDALSVTDSVLSGWESDDDPVSTRSGSQLSARGEGDMRGSQQRGAEGSQDRQSGAAGEAVSAKNTKASLRIASENVRGRGAQTIGGSQKWKKIAEDMRRGKIGVMAVQETHLSEEHVDEIQTIYRHLRVFNTALPANPTGAGGVALVFNTLLTNTKGVKPSVLEPGRAIMVNFEWHRGKRLTVLAVYAPTDEAENDALWLRLSEKLAATRIVLPKPDVVLGDFNFVEDSVDRFPARMTRMDAPESFKTLKRMLRVKDGWRDMNPGRTDWSWRDPQRRYMSRIDRIYVTDGLLRGSRDWSIEISGITKDDHSRVGATIYALDGPDVGKGRWAMRDSLTRDEQFLHEANRILRDAETEMGAIEVLGRTAERNCQRVWARAKGELRRAAKKRTSEINCKRERRLLGLLDEKAKLVASMSAAGGTEDESERSRHLRELEDKIFAEKARAHRWTFLTRSTRAWAEGETMAKSWFNWPRERKKSEEIPFLVRPGSQPPILASGGQQMAEIARDYHEEIQERDLDGNPGRREQAIADSLRSIHVRLRDDDRAALGARADRDQVARAIREAKNGKAAGTDGLIHELWKALDAKYRAQRGHKKEWCDVAGIMTWVFRDVEDYGVDAEAGFTEGWMCPLFKKGERSDIANYRPITLLNTDYKLYTKTLAVRLAGVAQYLVHPSQAGFVRGRSITDHIKITTLMLDYAEAMEQDGAIIALDQEKAYDRVRHDYLLRALENLGFPEEFVSKIARLYEHAYTRVMVNGHLSSAYRVTRGVRQGDPLSCLLFNLAIEPLSAMLRASDLSGYKIEGVEERLIATLYADDTTVYLAGDDSYEALEKILTEWCTASGAKFTIKKTEVIPIGSAAHRLRVVESRRLHETDVEFPQGVRIAKDGEVTRILGAWPGNCVKHAAVWSTVEDRVIDRLDGWERTRPTLAGRAIITQVVVGGCTQYLTAAQGMPQHIAKSLDTTALNFFWRPSRRHPVNMETLRLPKKEGGMNLVHIQARNDAQYLTWVSAYLAPPETRPLWAFIGECILMARTIAEHRRRVPPEQWGNPFCYDWRANIYALPFILQQMMRVDKKYQVVLDDPLVPSSVRESQPIWTHPALLDPGALEFGKMDLKCLRTRHAVRTVEDMEEIAELDDPDHEDASTCGCENCMTDRAEGCKDPARCQRAAAEILSLIAEKWNTVSAEDARERPLWIDLHGDREEALERGEALVFDGRQPPVERTVDLCRVFVDTLAVSPSSADKLLRRPAGQRAQATTDEGAVTAVACAGVAQDEDGGMRGGFAVHFPDEEMWDVMHGYGEEDPSYNKCAALAVAAAAAKSPGERVLHILMTSKLVAGALTVDLGEHERTGWMRLPRIGGELRLAAAALRARGAETTITCISGKRAKDWPEIVTVRNMAQVAATCCGPMEIDRATLRDFDRPGRSILGLSQRDAHKAIRARASAGAGTRNATAENLATIKSSVLAECGREPSTAQIWHDLQDRCLSRTVRNFLWKGIHGAHKVGDYFRKMPEPWRSMANCETFGTTESMEHILFHCPDSGQRTVWQIVGWLLAHKMVDAKFDMGMVWGCASFSGSGDEGADRAVKIIVSEAAFLIWKIRCEKRIEHADEPEWQLSRSAIISRWKAVIGRRRRQDQRLADFRLFGNRALDPALVASTWRDSVNSNFWELYRSRKGPGVLVGTATRNASGVG